MKESFVIYKSFYVPIKGLSDKQLGRLFRALFDYQIDGSTQVDADIQMAFAFFKNQMDIDESKYQKVVQRNKLNGSKGGRPTKEENPKNPVGLEKPKKPDNGNDNDNDFKIIYPYQDIVELWNSTCPNLPKVTSLSESRKKKIKCRLNEFSRNPDDWNNAINHLFTKIAKSNFLNFGNDKGWGATFDWVFENDKNWRKVIDGNYDNNPVKQQCKQSTFEKNSIAKKESDLLIKKIFNNE